MSGETSSNSNGAGVVKVRMYNVLFGDCFLLTFSGSDGSDHYMLIDCGTIRSEESKKMIEKVVDNIIEDTHNHIDVLVISHEHADHIIGFDYCQEKFKGFNVDQVWLAWTEDPSDELAKELKSDHENKIKILRIAEKTLRIAGRASADLVSNALSFELPGKMGIAEESDLVEFIRKKSKNPLKPSDYLKPGQTPLVIPGVDDVRVFVLAPSRNKAQLKILERKSETYLRAHNISSLSSFTSAVENLSGDAESESVWSNKPFDDYFEFTPKKAEKSENPYREFLEDHYGLTKDDERNPAWRRIDVDWLDAAGQLALDVGDATNNTSLVLAIELTATEPRKVILLTGDAQVGSWLSWPIETSLGEGLEGATVNLDSLFGEVVLLKVGHHGSKNATMKKKGLEKMTSGDLVAMIPVNEEISKKRFNGAHPSSKLLDALMAQTSGRVLRSDKIPESQSSMQPPPGYDSEAWLEFTKMVRVHQEKLWVEYTIS